MLPAVAELYREIRAVLEQARTSAYRAVNTVMVQSYWQVGRLILEHEQGGQKRAAYGQAVLEELSRKLTTEYGRGFTRSNLGYMRQFYLAFPIHHTVCGELPAPPKRHAVRAESQSTHWSVRQLDRQISVRYYERLLASRTKTPIRREARAKLANVTPEQFIRDPYVLEFLDLKDYPGLRESKVEQAIVDNIQTFLLELGTGFAFVARQKRMQFDEEDFYVDLVFYNYVLRCFVLVDLKAGKLTHQDVGQMDSYVRMFDAHSRPKGDNPTIGLILCSHKNETIARYSVLADARQIFAAKYVKVLPTEQALASQVERERRLTAERRSEGT